MRHATISQPLETPRLLIRHFVEDDAEAAFTGWFGDPQVMQFTPGGPDRTVGDTRKRLAMYRQHQASQGFSKWLVQDRDSGEPIGDSGLLILDGAGHVDLGLRIARAYWGRGLATEITSAWCRVAFGELGLERLTAFAHPDNYALRRVFDKTGFQPDGAATVMDMEVVVFVLAAEAFRAAAPVA